MVLELSSGDVGNLDTLETWHAMETRDNVVTWRLGCSWPLCVLKHLVYQEYLGQPGKLGDIGQPYHFRHPGLLRQG